MKLSNGFELEIDENGLDDWEILEILCDLDEGKFGKMPKVFSALIGEEQFVALKAYLKEKDGKVRISAMQNVLAEMFATLKEGKKSLPLQE